MVDHRRAVTGGGDRANQGIGAHRGIMLDMGLFDREVDGGRHPVETVEAALDSRGAGRAGHPGQSQVRDRHDPEYTPRGYMCRG